MDMSRTEDLKFVDLRRKGNYRARKVKLTVGGVPGKYTAWKPGFFETTRLWEGSYLFQVAL